MSVERKLDWVSDALRERILFVSNIQLSWKSWLGRKNGTNLECQCQDKEKIPSQKMPAGNCWNSSSMIYIFFVSIQNKNSITGKPAIFAIRRKKTRRKNLELLEKIDYWLSSSIALCEEFISGSWHEQHFLMCWHTEEYILAQHCSWSEFSVLQKEIQISENVQFPDG